MKRIRGPSRLIVERIKPGDDVNPLNLVRLKCGHTPRTNAQRRVRCWKCLAGKYQRPG